MSDLEELVKLDSESILYDMDFSNQLTSGETIGGTPSAVSTSSSRVPGSSNVTLGEVGFLGPVAQLRISGGTVGEIYTIAITITTNLGNTRVGKGLLRVE